MRQLLQRVLQGGRKSRNLSAVKHPPRKDTFGQIYAKAYLQKLAYRRYNSVADNRRDDMGCVRAVLLVLSDRIYSAKAALYAACADDLFVLYSRGFDICGNFIFERSAART